MWIICCRKHCVCKYISSYITYDDTHTHLYVVKSVDYMELNVIPLFLNGVQPVKPLYVTYTLGND